MKPPGPIAQGLRIGLLGGSFNPAHAGHIHISEVARKRLRLDYVWWLVTPQNPLKPADGMMPFVQRLDSARAVATRYPHIIVSGIEREMGTRYTVDTLARLRPRFREVRFVWLMGSDALAGFHRWRRWPKILEQVPVAVVTRPASVLSVLSAKPLQRFASARASDPRQIVCAAPPVIAVLDGPRNPLSSTALRRASVT